MTSVPAVEVPKAPRRIGAGTTWRPQATMIAVAALLIAGGIGWMVAAGMPWRDAFDRVGARAAWPIGLLVLPGLALLGLALRRAHRLRALLVHGDVSPVEILWHEPPRLWSPGIRIAYRFRGCDGGPREATVRVAERSREAECLRRGGAGLIALCDPLLPERSTLCAATRLAADGR